MSRSLESAIESVGYENYILSLSDPDIPFDHAGIPSGHYTGRHAKVSPTEAEEKKYRELGSEEWWQKYWEDRKKPSRL